MFLFWFSAMTKWFGILGSFLAIILSPGLVIFPAIYWLVEGIFPTVYFMIWGVGILGLLLALLVSRNEY